MLCTPPSNESEFLAILDLVFANLNANERDDRVATLRLWYEQYEQAGIDPPGIWGVYGTTGRLLGGLFSEVRPDGTILLWPAAFRHDTIEDEAFDHDTFDHDSDQTAGNEYVELLHPQNILRLLYSRYVAYCDALEPEKGSPSPKTGKGKQSRVLTVIPFEPFLWIDVDLLEEFGFVPLSKLIHLLCTEPHFLPPPTRPRLAFRPMRASETNPNTADAGDWTAMAAIVEQTYRNTLDFPQLAAVLPAEDNLSGYTAETVFRPELWFFVHETNAEHDCESGDASVNAPVGALLLTPASERFEMEITYMGLIESARGKGFAKEIIAFAQDRARQEGVEILMTASDHQNDPAMRAYLGAGFRIIDEHILFFR